MRKVCYVGGIGRSGSTILDILLAQSPNVFGAGQLAALHRELDSCCSCGQAVRDCSVWGQALVDFGLSRLPQLVEWNELVFKERRLYRFLCSRHFCRQFARLNDELFDALFALTNASVIVDSSKNLSRGIGLLKGSRHEVYFLHLIRDSRGYINSVNDYCGGRKNSARFFFPMLEWTAKNGIASLAAKRFAHGHATQVRFEELMTSPAKVLQDIADWLDVDLSESIRCVEDAAALHRDHVFSGNRLLRKSDLRFAPEDMIAKNPLRGMDNTLFWLAGGWLSSFWGYRRQAR